MTKPLFESAQDISNKYFVGTVVATDDPESKSRARVKIDGMTDTLETTQLPWYAVIATAGGNNNAAVYVPSINSRVLVSFPDGDIYNGVITFMLPQNLSS